MIDASCRNRCKRDWEITAVSLFRCRRLLFISLCLLIVRPHTVLCALDSLPEPNQNPNLLDENSVVLITGIAGSLGSELALALHHTYRVQAIIGIDAFVGGTLPTSYGWAGDGTTTPKMPTFIQFLLEKEPGFQSKKGEIDHLDYKMKKRWILKAKREFQIFDLQRQRMSRLVQTLGRKLYLHKADLRVSLPEYFDLGQIPILDTIFTSHHHYREDSDKEHRSNTVWKGITHVVHLAEDKITNLDGKEVDELVRDSFKVLNRTITLEELYDTIIVPRGKEDIRAGMMETLMEQLVKVKRSTLDQQLNNHTEGMPTVTWPRVPHFVYASSYEVYNYLDHLVLPDEALTQGDSITLKSDNAQSVLMKEGTPLTTPSSMRGAQKILDEMLANIYHKHHGIFSIGLRFFPIYGPWCSPDDKNPLFNMAARAVGIVDGKDLGSPSVPILPLQHKFPNKDLVSLLSTLSPFQHIRDFVYIDDAVDAILAAMQYYPTSTSKDDKHNSATPFVVNVGSGEGSSLVSIAQEMEKYMPRSNEQVSMSTIVARETQKELDVAKGDGVTIAIASTERAERVLGFKAQTSLHEGILHLMSWHWDRVSYFRRKVNLDQWAKGSPVSTVDTAAIFQEARNEKARTLLQSGMYACSPLDEECLRGRSVFPCVSECADDRFCTPSIYDHVAYMSRLLTSQCSTVLYTVSWDRDLQNILSAVMSISPESVSFVDPSDAMSSDLKGITLKDKTSKSIKSVGYSCNIAFISEESELAQRLKRELGLSRVFNVGNEMLTLLSQYQSESSKAVRKELLNKLDRVILKHGLWTIIPLSIPDEFYSTDYDENFEYYNSLKLLPKLSPGYFFSSPANRHAIYCDTNVLFNNVNKLVDLLYKPQTNDESIQRLYPGKTIMVVPGAKRRNHHFVETIMKSAESESVLERMNSDNIASQERLYTLVRSATRGIMFGSGSSDDVVDSKWLVHLLDHDDDDAMRLRCDVYHEVSTWKLSSDHLTIEFILALHDIRNKLRYIWDDKTIWWKTKATISSIFTLNESSRNLQAQRDGEVNCYLMSLSFPKTKGHQSFVRIIPSSDVGAVVIQDY